MNETMSEKMKQTTSELNTRTRVINDIHFERLRQDNKWGKQNHPHPIWLAILMEEVGEVAQAVQSNKSWSKASDANDLYKELIQVAAVATAIAEQVIRHGQDSSN